MEIRQDMLPDKKDTEEEGVKTPSVSEDVKTEEERTLDEGNQEESHEQAGDKTPENNLLAALKEEREERKKLADKLKKLEKSLEPSDEDEEPDDDKERIDEDKVAKEISSLKKKINSLEEGFTLDKLFVQHPALKDKLEDFNDFRKDYPRTALDKVAKLFLVEKGLLKTETPDRQGLESPTSGDKTPIKSGYSVEDIKRLRENNYRQYEKLVVEGKIKPENIK